MHQLRFTFRSTFVSVFFIYGFYFLISIQSRFGWSVLQSDLFTVINELFRWFSHSNRLFFPSRLTSCYGSARLFLLHALISRQLVRSPTRRHPTSLPIASASRNFLSSSLFRSSDSQVFIGQNGLSSAVLHLIVSSATFHSVLLTRESMSLITFHHHMRLIRARIYPTCQLQCSLL